MSLPVTHHHPRRYGPRTGCAPMRDAAIVRERVGPWSASAYLRMAHVNARYPALSDGAKGLLGLLTVRSSDRGRVRGWPWRLPLAARTSTKRRLLELTDAGFVVRVRRSEDRHPERGGLLVRLALPRGEPRERLED